MKVSPRILDQLIQPLARFCIAYGIRFQELLTAMKKGMVEQARRALTQDGIEPNTTKISVMTGLQRPDVLRHSEPDTIRSKPSAISQIVSTWMYSQRFRNKKGEPRVLSPEGRDSEFAKLVASVSKELSAYTVLFEMERAGLITHTDDGVQLITSAHLVGNDADQGLEIFAKDMNDLTDAVHENLSSETPPHLHIRVDYDNIPLEKLPELKNKVFSMSQHFLVDVQRVIASYDKDMNAESISEEKKIGEQSQEGHGRFSLTIFTYNQ
jgi:hypothetical protein